MPTTIIMPQLGESVAEGVIGKWLKQQGDDVEKDEPIVEVITDKVNAEIPSPVAGKLQKITQEEGATVAVGQEIAIIGDDGKAEAEPANADAASGNGQKTVSSGGVSTTTTSSSGDRVRAEAGGAASVGAEGDGRGERVRSSPLVRRLAEQHGINLSEVTGTGLGGRVSKQDIMAFVEQKGQGGTAVAERSHFEATDLFEREVATQAAPRAPTAPPTAKQPGPTRPLGANEELIPVPVLRKMIADRMVLSQFTIPHATTNVEVDMTNVVRFREARKGDFRKQEGMPLSYVAFVIKATVEALKQHPMVNAEWAGDSIILKKNININVAVDAPEGLTTPVIHHAEEMSVAGLSKAIYDLADRARNKKLKIEDMQGGTFTVNNTGALGSVSGVSIINYPQGGILSAGTLVKRPVVVEQDGQDLIAVRTMMNLSFSFDHRLLDGGYASAFVNSVRDNLEAWSMEHPLY
jgi:2-oxoisovalerate dehydrogenase E2 component (dihydrolipoyl transacylase)